MDAPSRSIPGLWPGLIFIALGGGLLARELGLLPADVALVDFWPLAVVVFGLAQLAQTRSAVGAFFSLGFAVLGGVLLAGNLGFGSFPAERYWPALLVMLGLSFLFGGRNKTRSWHTKHDFKKRYVDGEHAVEVVTDENRLQRSVTCSGSHIRIESQAWTGGELSAFASGVEMDLRYARLAEGGATLNLQVVMAGIDIRVPDTWLVVCDITPTLGGADDVTRSTQGDPSAPRLRVVGSVTLGGVSIRN